MLEVMIMMSLLAHVPGPVDVHLDDTNIDPVCGHH